MISSLLQFKDSWRSAGDATRFIEGFLIMANSGALDEHNSAYLNSCFTMSQELTDTIDEAIRNLDAPEH